MFKSAGPAMPQKVCHPKRTAQHLRTVKQRERRWRLFFNITQKAKEEELYHTSLVG